MSMLKIKTPEELPLYIRVALAKRPSFSQKQAEMMLHAIGADSKAPRNYMGRKIYHAFRNHYYAGEPDVADWDDLVGKGYAIKTTHYKVTPEGLSVLEVLTGSTIYGNYWNCADCRGAVLTAFLKSDVYCGYGCWYPTSAKSVAAYLHIPLGIVRDACRKLAAEGLIKRGYYGDMDDEGNVRCCHGYYVTEKGKALDEWKALWEQEVEYINNMVNGTEGNDEIHG